VSATEILDRAIEAYGGEERWRSIDEIEARVSCSGLLFRWKRGHGYDDLSLKAKVWEPWCRLAPVDKRGSLGILDGHDVRIETPAGELVDERHYAREKFPYGRRFFHWDLIDVVYFTAYAFWNYLTLPALLIRDDVKWKQIGESTLESNFPDWIPTHCRHQKFHFDPETGLLSQYDYTAEVFGGFAKASHVIEHAESDGVVYTSDRHIMPTIAGKPGKFPLLIHGVVHEYHPIERTAATATAP
jgi:hypothetical protein